MSREHHVWKIGQLPPTIRPHSLAKHRVFRAYLERYVSVLTADPRQDQFRLTLVDGFSGGGVYLDSRSKEEKSGSPLIMLEAMEKAAEEAQKIRSKRFHLDVQFIFVEKDAETLAYLRSVIAETRFGNLIDDRIRLIQGEFTANVPEITRFVQQRGRAERVIFMLDQFGYSEVPLPTIREILSTLKNAEVILTFATDSLIDYLSEHHEQSQTILQNVGIVLPSKDIADAKANPDWRRAIQYSLHRQIPERTGAKYYTPFFIRSADAHRDFWLIHLSGHFRARDVMVGLHWKESTSFAHYGGSGLGMLGYNQYHDAEWTRQRMLPGFFFDEMALKSSQEELAEQLPRHLCEFRDGIGFNDLFSTLTNECPVTADIMKGVLSELAKSGIIEVRDKTGTQARRAGIQHDTDIILLSRQRRMFVT